MSTTKFTLGPWWVSGRGEVIKMPEQIHICNWVSGATPEEAYANRRLIEKSPDMYDMLRGISEDIQKNALDQYATMHSIETLLKKIRGDQ